MKKIGIPLSINVITSIVMSLLVNISMAVYIIVTDSQSALLLLLMLDACLLSIILSYRKKVGAFSFSLLFSLMWFLYSAGVLMDDLLGGNRNMSEYNVLLLMSGMALLGFIVGHNVSRAKIKRAENSSYEINEDILYYAACCVLLIALMSKIYVISRVGIRDYFFSSRSYRNLRLRTVSGFISSLAFLFPLVSVVTLQSYISFGKIRWLFIHIFSTGFFIVISILEIDRSNFLLIVLPIIYTLFKNKKVSMNKVVLFGIVLFFLFMQWKTFLGTAIYSGKMTLDMIIEVPAELYAWMDAGKVIVSEEVVQSGMIGKSYLAALESMVRPIGQNYESLSTWLVRTYYPSIYEAGGGLGFSMILEGYLNGGLLGVFFLFLGIGVISRKIEYYSNRFFGSCFYALFLSMIYKIFRSELYSILKVSFWMWGVPLLLMAWLCKNVKVRSSN